MYIVYHTTRIVFDAKKKDPLVRAGLLGFGFEPTDSHPRYVFRVAPPPSKATQGVARIPVTTNLK